MRKFYRHPHILLGGIAILCISICIFCIVRIVSTTFDYKEGSRIYTDLTKYVSIPPKNPIDHSPESNPIPSIDVESKLEQKNLPAVDFKALQDINPDIVAWLICEDTPINYPVVQGIDNDYYLKHLFDGSSNGAGCLFVDVNNTSGFTDHNTVIYGHNMKDQSMFAFLTRYKDQAFYENHPEMVLLTPDGNYNIELFSGYMTTVEDESWKLSFSSDIEFEKWIAHTKARSSFVSYVDISRSERVITLSTCSYESSNARYIVVCKLVPAKM